MRDPLTSNQQQVGNLTLISVGLKMKENEEAAAEGEMEKNRHVLLHHAAATTTASPVI